MQDTLSTHLGRAAGIFVFFLFLITPAMADCLGDQMACTNNCILSRSDLSCVNRCGERAQSCIQREYEESTGSSNNSDDLSYRDQYYDEDDEAETAPAISGSGRAYGTDPQQEAQRIVFTCNSRCAQAKSECNAGSQSACYRAAACQCQCFLDEDTTNAPSRNQWRQCVADNTAKADQLRGAPTVITPNQTTRLPSSRPQSYSTTPSTKKSNCPPGVWCAGAARD